MTFWHFSDFLNVRDVTHYRADLSFGLTTQTPRKVSIVSFE